MTTATAPTASAPAAAAHPPLASPWPVFWVASVAAFLVSLAHPGRRAPAAPTSVAAEQAAEEPAR